MKTKLTLLALIAALTSCGSTPDSWAGTPNPLDLPQATEGIEHARTPVHGVFGPNWEARRAMDSYLGR